MSNQQQYELMAARIESVFTAHKIPVRVWQATVTPRFVRFDVTTALGVRLSAAERLDEEIAMALNVQSCRVYRDGGVVRVEAPRGTPRQVTLAGLLPRLTTVPALCALLGMDSDGAPLLLRIDSPDVAHVLIAGATGSGKSVLLRTLLLSLAMTNRPGQLQLALIDPKGRGLELLAGLPHMWQGADLAQSPDDAALLLACLVAEMERRDRERVRLPHVILAIDELADLVQTGGEPVVTALTRLTQRGREAGLHVIAATQRPASALIGGMMKANFPVRLVGSVTSVDDARVAAGISGTGAESLLGRGDFVLVAKGGQIRFQAAYANDGDMRRLAGLAASGGERRTRHWTAETLAAEPALAERSATRPGRSLAEIAEGLGLGGGVGIAPPPGLFLSSSVGISAHPTPPHPTKRPLRERYTVDQLVGYINQAGGSIKRAAEQAFGYSDSATLAIMREAQEATP